MIAAVAVMLMAAVPASEPRAIERLNAELLASPTATAVLERRCKALDSASRLHAEVERGQPAAGAVPSRTLLKVRRNEAVAFRRVRLMCGTIVLSEATNWYVPGRLTPEMNAALDSGDVPFGRVILPLKPQRRTLSVWTAKHLPARGEILRHRAIVLDGAGRPLAEVVERYQRAMID